MISRSLLLEVQIHCPTQISHPVPRPLSNAIPTAAQTPPLQSQTCSYNRPFRANSTFLAASPALKPPLDTHAMLPSPNSTLSSTSGKAQGQWCGKCTQLSVCGHRYLSQCAGITSISEWSRTTKVGSRRREEGEVPYRLRIASGTKRNRRACSALALAVAGRRRRTFARRIEIERL